MFAILDNWSPLEVTLLVLVLTLGWLVSYGLSQWNAVRIVQEEAQLKRDMLQRGMSVQEIKEVFQIQKSIYSQYDIPVKKSLATGTPISRLVFALTSNENPVSSKELEPFMAEVIQADDRTLQLLADAASQMADNYTSGNDMLYMLRGMFKGSQAKLQSACEENNEAEQVMAFNLQNR